MKTIYVLATIALTACSSDTASAPTVTGAKIMAPTSATAGDALTLSVVQTLSNGQTQAVPSTMSVSFTSPAKVTALPADSMDASPLPAFGTTPTATFLANPGRTDHSDLSHTLFVLDAGGGGNVTVTATVQGGAPVTATIAVSATPAGDATRGAKLYGASGVDCAACHGATGHGSPVDGNGTTYTLEGKAYDYPAPGLNAESGNVAGDPAWSAALLAFAARADVDNEGLTLRTPMPDWLAATNPQTGMPLSTQDFADIYAFLKTQTN